MKLTATAKSYSNIAFIKYWGNTNEALRMPANGSLSMNLEGIETITSVTFDEQLEADELVLNDTPQAGAALTRASLYLDCIRTLAKQTLKGRTVSSNNFPTGTGIASSASAFSALTLAAAHALELNLSERELSVLARQGSGSASRSVPGGFVEWYAGESSEESFAETIAPPEHWALVDLIAIVSKEHKAVGSTGGHKIAPTSPLQRARVLDTQRRLDVCREAILERNFTQLAEIIEHDTLMMHAVMMTSQPPLLYWKPETLYIMNSVQRWRADGLAAAFTIDAGPNVHVITTEQHHEEVRQRLLKLGEFDQVLMARPGGPAHLL